MYIPCSVGKIHISKYLMLFECISTLVVLHFKRNMGDISQDREVMIGNHL